ncbi:MAG: beta-propeller fold lactonase family protein [Bryobacteraceae bacterium]
MTALCRAMSRRAAICILLTLPRVAQAQLPATSYTNFEGAQTNALRLSADGTRLYVANTAAARISVFDLTQPASPTRIAEIPVGIEPVSVNPRTNDEVWVVNQESDSVSIVSVSKGIVTDTIYLPDEPADVVFAGSGLAFISVARRNQVCAVSVATHQITKCLPLMASNPRYLAVSPDGSKVYASVSLSGNRSTIIPGYEAPPPPPPTNPDLPPAPQQSLVVNIDNPRFSSILTYTMPDYDVAIIDSATVTVTGYYSGTGTLNFGIAVRPGTGDLYVANIDARNLIATEPKVRGHWVDNRITKIQVSNGQVTPIDLNPGINYAQLPNTNALSRTLAQPTAGVFDPTGASLWVAAFGSDRIAQLDPNGVVLNRIEIGPARGAAADPKNKKGPRALAIHPTAQKLYVLNRISNSITVIDTGSRSLLADIAVGSFDPTPTVIRTGRGFLYDAKLSGNGTGSCGSCHIDADMDHLAWDLGDPNGQMQTINSGGQSFQLHPMKGPMATQTLRGLANLAPYHWRGDKASFADFNGAFNSLMGNVPLSDSDMAAYTDFVNTIRFMPNPNQNLDRTYPTSLGGGNAAQGFTAFTTLATSSDGTCSFCHTVPGAGSNQQIVILKGETQPMKNPQLRNIYQRLNFNRGVGTPTKEGFGITHDGEAGTLPAFLSTVFSTLAQNPTLMANISAFCMAFDTGMAPTAGYTRTVTPANITQAPVQQDVALLVSQAAAGNIDLIAKGTIRGQAHGLLYNPATGKYQQDRSAAAPLTQAQLNGLIQAGDTITLMGVPPGSGTWMGIDFNLNGVLDGDEPK